MKKLKNKIRRWYYQWFSRKRIVHSSTHAPGEFVECLKAKDGSKWARIVITNQVRKAGTVPVTDVRWQDITSVDLLPSKAAIKLRRYFGLKITYKKLKVQP